MYKGAIAPTTENPTAFEVSQLNIYDPLLTGGDQQVLGWDQWVALYNKCKVIGGRVFSTFHNASTASAVVGITRQKEHETDNAGNNPFDYLLERPATRYRFLTPDVDKITLAHKWGTKKNFAI